MQGREMRKFLARRTAARQPPLSAVERIDDVTGMTGSRAARRCKRGFLISISTLSHNSGDFAPLDVPLCKNLCKGQCIHPSIHRMADSPDSLAANPGNGIMCVVGATLLLLLLDANNTGRVK